MKDKKQLILDTLSDTISNFLYYDRKEDDELPVWDIDSAILEGIITQQDLINHFTKIINEL